MDSVFFKSVLIKPPQIMGVKLRPFSAYHAMLLLQFDSPFMFEGGKPDTGDVAFALCVMASSVKDKYARYEKLTNSNVYASYWFCKLLFCRSSKLQKIISDIEAHIDGYTEYPQTWSKGGDGKSGVPWPFRVVATIWRNYRCTKDEAWDMGLSEAASFRACFAEDLGADVVDEWGIEGRHARWMRHPDRDKYESIEEFEAGEING